MGSKLGNNVVQVGTRGSALALCQTEEVLGRLRLRHSELDFQVNIVRTHGDADRTAPLAGMGLGVFVKEIEQQLLSGELDLAVHSLKDMPTGLPDGLVLGAVIDRQDPRDVLVNRWGCTLSQLPSGARIGTSSPRRMAQLKSICPQVDVLSIRGNVETRLEKSKGEDFDGAILAAAGLIRLGLDEHITQYISPFEFVPPPGQGAVGLEIRSTDERLQALLRPIEDFPTRQAVTAERGFLEKLGGGCQMPVGAHAVAEADKLVMRVFLSDPEGNNVFRLELLGSLHAPSELASHAYAELLANGHPELVRAVLATM